MSDKKSVDRLKEKREALLNEVERKSNILGVIAENYPAESQVYQVLEEVAFARWFIHWEGLDEAFAAFLAKTKQPLSEEEMCHMKEMLGEDYDNGDEQ